MKKNQNLDPLIQAKEFWNAVALHRWSILFMTFLVGAIAIVVIMLLPDHYTASTTVLFDLQKMGEQYVAPTVTADPAHRLNTLTNEVLSGGQLLQIAQRLHLGGKASPQQIIATMRKAITIEMKPNPEKEMNAFVITYTGSDPETVAAVANSLAQSFIDWDLANRGKRAKEAVEFMAAQLAEAKKTLDDEETKVNEYKLNHAGELPEELSANMQALSTLHASLQAKGEALDRLEQEKTMLTSVPETARTAPSAPTDRDRLEAERRTLQAELTQLRAEYTEQYPDVITTKQRLEAVTKQLNRTDAASSPTRVSTAEVRLQIIQRETERFEQEQQKLTERINKYQARVDAAPLRGQELDLLTRNYSGARAQYESLLEKKFRAGMALNLERQQKSSQFTVDPAQVPDTPIKPNRLLLFATVLPFCCLLPTGVAIASSEMGGKVNSERVLRPLLPDAARVLGRIPVIDTTESHRRQRRLAMLSISGSLLCCVLVTVFLLSGTVNRFKRPDHKFAPNNPIRETLSH